MRTKHLMTAMVLPALFAACANEELEVIGNNADNSRAVVENVVLDFSNGVESRLAYGVEGYAWEANMGLRQAYSFSVADQVLAGTSTADLQKSFTDNNDFLGYGKVAANANEGESVRVPMIPVFGATGFTLINTGTNTYKVEKVVLNGKAVSSYAVVKPSADNFSVAKATGEISETGVILVAGTVEVNSVASANAFLKVQKGANVNWINNYIPNGKVSNYSTIAKK